MHTLLSLNIREAFYRRQTSNKLMFMGEGRAFNHGCHNKSKEVMPFPTRFQHLCVFSIKSKRVEPIFTAPQNITENWLSSKSRAAERGTGALTNDYTELTLHFCLNNNYSFFQNFRVLNSNYTNLDRVE